MWLPSRLPNTFLLRRKQHDQSEHGAQCQENKQTNRLDDTERRRQGNITAQATSAEGSHIPSRLSMAAVREEEDLDGCSNARVLNSTDQQRDSSPIYLKRCLIPWQPHLGRERCVRDRRSTRTRRRKKKNNKKKKHKKNKKKKKKKTKKEKQEKAQHVEIEEHAATVLGEWARCGEYSLSNANRFGCRRRRRRRRR